MSPGLAEATRQQVDGIKSALAQLGPLKTVTFQSVGPGGADIFVAAFEHGSVEWRIALGDGGQIAALIFRRVAG